MKFLGGSKYKTYFYSMEQKIKIIQTFPNKWEIWTIFIFWIQQKIGKSPMKLNWEWGSLVCEFYFNKGNFA